MTLTDARDAYSFHVGMPVHTFVVGEHGGLVPATRRQRARLWIRDRWLGATRWFRPRTVISAVDRQAGSVSLVDERWSWRRWRWERIE